MKIVTWNMNYWQRRKRHEEAWRYLIDELQPDIALLQETRPPDAYRGDNLTYEGHSTRYDWGSAIYTKGLPLERVPLETYKAWVIAGRVTLPDGKVLTAVSLQAPIEKGYSITMLHHIFSDLTHLLDRSKHKLVGGDFNAGLLWDEVQGSRTHKVMFDRVEAFGLTNCHRRFHDREEQTFRRKGGRPYQLDHLFIDDKLAGGLVSCDVLYNEKIEVLSDHNPLVAVVEV